MTCCYACCHLPGPGSDRDETPDRVSVERRTRRAPCGGVKEPGMGCEGSGYGILDYTEMKYVCVGGVS